MSNKNAPGKFITAPTISRGRRCQNCVGFDNGPRAQQHYDVKRLQELQHKAREILERDGKLPDSLLRGELPGPERIGADDDAFDHFAKNFQMGDSYMQAGMMGICQKSQVGTDFVHAMYLCEKWEQKFKPDDAEAGDETSEEAKDRMGYK